MCFTHGQRCNPRNQGEVGISTGAVKGRIAPHIQMKKLTRIFFAFAFGDTFAYEGEVCRGPCGPRLAFQCVCAATTNHDPAEGVEGLASQNATVGIGDRHTFSGLREECRNDLTQLICRLETARLTFPKRGSTKSTLLGLIPTAIDINILRETVR